MKRFLAVAMLVSACLPLLALRPGDQAAPFESIKWLRGTPPPLGSGAAARTGGEASGFAAVVCFRFLAPGSAQTLTMLEELARGSGARLKIAVVSPESEPDVADALRQRPVSPVAYGVDSGRDFTRKYMGSSVLFPTAFLISSSGKILWCGEAMDLPEMFENACASKIDVDKQREVARLTDEMMQRLRDTSDRGVAAAAERIFKLDPANASALRIRLFMLENSGRISEAWKLLFARITAAPRVPRLYFTAIDLVSRYPELGSELEPTVARFKKEITSLPARQTMLWTLLNDFSLNTEALRNAAELQASAEAAAASSPLAAGPEVRASLASSRALLAYSLGDLDAAIAAQTAATALWKQLGSAAAVADSERRARFYRDARDLRDRFQAAQDVGNSSLQRSRKPNQQEEKR